MGRESSGGRRRPAAVAATGLAICALAAGCTSSPSGGPTRPTRVHLAAATADPNANCTLIVPANPLTPAGLATPYQLTATNPADGPCNEANIAQSAFVQGAIITQDGQLTLYDPLVIDAGTQPAAPPAMAQVPAGATVGLWFGFNGDNLTLQAANGTDSLAQGNCVNGLNGSIFGQFAHCNAPAFFQTANQQIAANKLQVPPLGMAKDGLPCPTVRDFSLIDQDQSDNVTAQYLALPNGQTAQKNAAAAAAIGNAVNNAVNLANASDNVLLDVFVLPTLGCTPSTRPNGAQDGQATGSLPLNELQAAAFQAAPIALLPLNDPMTLVNNNPSADKTNLFRLGVDQPPLGAAGSDNGDGAAYCNNLFTNPAGIRRVFNAQAIFAAGQTPDAATGTNLFTFLAARANGSFENLNCANFGVANPITLTLDGNGVATAAAIAPAGQPAPAAGGQAAGGQAAPAAGGQGMPAAGGQAAPAAGGQTTPAAGGQTTAQAGGQTAATTAAPPRNGRRQVGMQGRFRNW
ncbi:hypothetical protein [Frankia canadensis]|uniref:hypothetical protein n=1 Tax=Frankia canadensis TaxID=1836972 RepID=UPI001A9C8B9F|nr:hypothetical protein [Frankia canadensis]